jgi:hypothetical protein
MLIQVFEQEIPGSELRLAMIAREESSRFQGSGYTPKGRFGTQRRKGSRSITTGSIQLANRPNLHDLLSMLALTVCSFPLLLDSSLINAQFVHVASMRVICGILCRPLVHPWLRIVDDLCSLTNVGSGIVFMVCAGFPFRCSRGGYRT